MDATALAVLQEEDEYVLDLDSPSAWCRTQVDGKTGSVAVFETGMGDGCYGTYFGFSGKDIVCVTTDFQIGS